jgi:septal ring factor EnvC (AmiA/AmiB activator)
MVATAAPNALPSGNCGHDSAEPDVAAQFITLALAGLGVAGLIFTALRFRRDDTTAVVTQQSTILNNMQALMEEQQRTLEDTRSERDRLRAEVTRLSGEIDRLRHVSDAGA